MKFKYQEDLNLTQTSCPPNDFINKNMEAYRWVFDKISDPENFKPLAKKNPARILSMEDKAKCKAYSLSMFNSHEAANNRFQFFKKSMSDKAYKLLGNNVAKGNIKDEHGVSSVEDQNGHFSHFPYESVDFTTIFKIIDKL